MSQVLEKKEIINSKIHIPDEFFKSEKYLGLKKEIEEAVSAALQSNEEEDIEPLIELLNKQMAVYDLDRSVKEKLFWDIVAGSLAANVYKDINEKIQPFVDEGKYDEADALINEEIKEAVRKLSHTIYKDPSRGGFARIILKDKFYSYFPELNLLREAIIKNPNQKIEDGPLKYEDDLNLEDESRSGENLSS